MESADIREWRRHDVVDQKGKKTGTLESVHVVTGTDERPFGCAGAVEAAVGPEPRQVTQQRGCVGAGGVKAHNSTQSS